MKRGEIWKIVTNSNQGIPTEWNLALVLHPPIPDTRGFYSGLVEVLFRNQILTIPAEWFVEHLGKW